MAEDVDATEVVARLLSKWCCIGSRRRLGLSPGDGCGIVDVATAPNSLPMAESAQPPATSAGFGSAYRQVGKSAETNAFFLDKTLEFLS